MTFHRVSLTLLLGLLLASAALAEDWIYIGDNELGRHFINMSATRLPTGHVLFWERNILSPDRISKMPFFRVNQVAIIDAKIEWDAEAGMYRFRNRILSRADRSVVQSMDEATPWEKPDPNSIIMEAIRSAERQVVQKGLGR